MNTDNRFQIEKMVQYITIGQSPKSIIAVCENRHTLKRDMQLTHDCILDHHGAPVVFSSRDSIAITSDLFDGENKIFFITRTLDTDRIRGLCFDRFYDLSVNGLSSQLRQLLAMLATSVR
jgi:hypothetical protein